MNCLIYSQPILTKTPTTIAGTVIGSVKILKIPNPTANIAERMMKLCGHSSTGRVGCIIAIGTICPWISGTVCDGICGDGGSWSGGCTGKNDGCICGDGKNSDNGGTCVVVKGADVVGCDDDIGCDVGSGTCVVGCGDTCTCIHIIKP